MFWYILFVRTGREKNVELLLKNRLNNNILIPFIPMIETLFKVSGEIRKYVRPLFPGYVFVESDVPGMDFINIIREVIDTSKDIICFLSYGSSKEISLREDEKQMILNMCNSEHCIEASIGIIEGDNVVIKEGPLKGCESIIKRIDRHKRQAIIELMLFGQYRHICITLDIIEKR